MVSCRMEWPGPLPAHGHTSKTISVFPNFNCGSGCGFQWHALPTPGSQAATPASWGGGCTGKGASLGIPGPCGLEREGDSGTPAPCGASDLGGSLACRDPAVRRLRPAHPGPLHPQGAGPPLAQQVPQVHRLPRAPGRALLQPRGERLLQGRFLQVSEAGGWRGEGRGAVCSCRAGLFCHPGRAGGGSSGGQAWLAQPLNSLQVINFANHGNSRSKRQS